jgi:hypothetical protein
LLCVAFGGLGALAAISVALSAMPSWLKLPMALLALWHGARLARREWRRPHCALEFGGTGDEVAMNFRGERRSMDRVEFKLRGALATLAWRDGDGRRQSLLWFADTLPARSRRQLRLRLSMSTNT